MRKVSITIISILVLCVLFFIAISLQSICLKKSFEAEYTPLEADYIVNATFKRCGINVFKPEFAKITEYKDENEKNIAFYKPKHLFSQSEEEWDKSYIGGTTVKNTTFPELVAMVKEDCEQFQQGGRKGEMEWIYSPAPTQEEITEEKLDSLERIFYGLGTRANAKFIEVYGDINTMTDEQKVALRDRIDNEGLDPAVERLRVIEESRKGFSALTESQQKAIRQQYGNWEDLNDDAFLEWKAVIDADYEAGKFNLDDY